MRPTIVAPDGSSGPEDGGPAIVTMEPPSLGGSLEAKSLDPSRSSSQLSFIMKERLHSLAADIHRRTNDLREELRRPPTPDEVQPPPKPDTATAAPQSSQPEAPSTPPPEDGQRPAWHQRVVERLKTMRLGPPMAVQLM